LTDTLIDHHVPLIGDEPVKYLTENLHWRCANSEDHAVPRENVPSLKVVVQSAGYVFPPEGIGARPERDEWTRHSPVTRGKLGGVNHGHEF
jgi:Tyosinase C-terminal domain